MSKSQERDLLKLKEEGNSDHQLFNFIIICKSMANIKPKVIFEDKDVLIT